jgi:hypothetical protein
MGKNMHGKAGTSTVYKVPIGTLVYKIPNQILESLSSGEFLDKPTLKPVVAPLDCELIADLSKENQELTLCKGGIGGKGNTHFKSATNQAPHQFTQGTKAEEGYFLLELRKIADVGLVGYPNAGKSTLISKISAAHPRLLRIRSRLSTQSLESSSSTDIRGPLSRISQVSLKVLTEMLGWDTIFFGTSFVANYWFSLLMPQAVKGVIR